MIQSGIRAPKATWPNNILWQDCVAVRTCIRRTPYIGQPERGTGVDKARLACGEPATDGNGCVKLFKGIAFDEFKRVQQLSSTRADPVLHFAHDVPATISHVLHTRTNEAVWSGGNLCSYNGHVNHSYTLSRHHRLRYSTFVTGLLLYMLMPQAVMDISHRSLNRRRRLSG